MVDHGYQLTIYGHSKAMDRYAWDNEKQRLNMVINKQYMAVVRPSMDVLETRKTIVEHGYH